MTAFIEFLKALPLISIIWMIFDIATTVLWVILLHIYTKNTSTYLNGETFFTRDNQKHVNKIRNRIRKNRDLQ